MGEEEDLDSWVPPKSSHEEHMELSQAAALCAAKQWIEAVIKKEMKFSDDLRRSLEDGVCLCELLNGLKPGCIRKINRLPSPMARLDNLNVFFGTCRRVFSIRDGYLFDLHDLDDLTQRAFNEEELEFESKKRLLRVAVCVFWVAKASESFYSGPSLNYKAFSSIVNDQHRSLSSWNPKKTVPKKANNSFAPPSIPKAVKQEQNSTNSSRPTRPLSKPSTQTKPSRFSLKDPNYLTRQAEELLAKMKESPIAKKSHESDDEEAGLWQESLTSWREKRRRASATQSSKALQLKTSEERNLQKKFLRSQSVGVILELESLDRFSFEHVDTDVFSNSDNETQSVDFDLLQSAGEETLKLAIASRAPPVSPPTFRRQFAPSPEISESRESSANLSADPSVDERRDSTGGRKKEGEDAERILRNDPVIPSALAVSFVEDELTPSELSKEDNESPVTKEESTPLSKVEDPFVDSTDKPSSSDINGNLIIESTKPEKPQCNGVELPAKKKAPLPPPSQVHGRKKGPAPPPPVLRSLSDEKRSPLTPPRQRRTSDKSSLSTDTERTSQVDVVANGRSQTRNHSVTEAVKVIELEERRHSVPTPKVDDLQIHEEIVVPSNSSQMLATNDNERPDQYSTEPFSLPRTQKKSKKNDVATQDNHHRNRIASLDLIGISRSKPHLQETRRSTEPNVQPQEKVYEFLVHEARSKQTNATHSSKLHECSVCAKTLCQEVVSVALKSYGLHFHVTCFYCWNCKRPFGESFSRGGLYVTNGRLFCLRCDSANRGMTVLKLGRF